MPARVVLSWTVVDEMAAAFALALDGGRLTLYADSSAAPGTPQDDVLPDVVILAAFDLPLSDAGVVLNGVVTVAPLAPVAAAISGRIGWARVERDTGAGLMLPNVGVDDEALVVSSLDVVEGEPVSVASWQFVVPTISGDG
jgi:hypothetical protein